MWALGFLLRFLAMQPVAQVDSTGTWCYDSQDPECGPTHWKELAPACGGPAQSPINIDLRLVQRDYTLEPFIFQGYDKAPLDPWTLENNGHTVLLQVSSGQQNCPGIRGAGLPSPGYRLLQLHFHWGSPGHKGSEHSLDQKHGSMEMHMVHMNTKYRDLREAQRHPDGLAVLAVLLVISQTFHLGPSHLWKQTHTEPQSLSHWNSLQEEDRDNTNFSAIVSALKNLSLPGVSVNLTSTFPLASLLPSAVGLLRYYRYSGSLTTPGCEPAVLWTVFENTVPIGRAQVAQFQTIPQTGPPGLHPRPLVDNLRPQQPLGGRRVLASPGASLRSSVSTLPCLHLALLGLGVGLRLWQGP
ncbi:carbonic anhydrase 15 isoform X1 [Peromyscus leucopus]|uniref:carbonic anhydrase 15 isoform X1 n=1 Tax=Peromyscus leucopus TaxID=10041 RepID=UPI0010A16BBA|nr:carbonic anhydrase 15 isoform X1 [Peromyscus leucopus]